MSAYDKDFSDAIYGIEEDNRYVTEPRLRRMLNHEVELIEDRILREKHPDKLFFAFANTVATIDFSKKFKGHGWVGIKFQLDPLEDYNEIILHIRFKENDARLQQETLGVLGVNLIFGAFYKYNDPKKLLRYPSCVSSLEDFNGEWFYIGANSKNEQGFTGSVSEITFWNVSLSQEDVRVLYLENVEGLIYNPVLWYKCNRGYGTFILDETSYENNGFFKTPSKTDSINFYNLPFGSTERMAMIGDKAKKVGSKFITHEKEEIKLGYKVKMPDRRFGEYKSLSNNPADMFRLHRSARTSFFSDVSYRESILENLQSYDPDILLNSDIFFITYSNIDCIFLTLVI